MTNTWSAAAGARLPVIIGASNDGRFHSPDSQAGRPCVVISLGLSGADAAKARWLRVREAAPALQALGADLLALAPQSAAVAACLADDPAARTHVVYLADDAPLSIMSGDGEVAFIADAAGRIVQAVQFSDGGELVSAVIRLQSALTREPPAVRALGAPLLLLPNLLAPEIRRALIDAFERGEHRQGAMAGIVAGTVGPKVDESKKHRRDIELQAGGPWHGALLEVLASRVVPEVSRAFRCEIASADRIMLARYDEGGGYFKRHRDNVAPQTAFRDFAVSINLNTGDYEGGELCFPEYDDHLYNPPAGAAAVFSASILHEARPVTRGSRYVALSFLCMAKAEGQSQAA